ncbi:MAG: nuclear transport factor 2 family protein [Flavisolibacter sp.]|nr:nuclear transport factor 2 family protein [Flavisolibacter sp.]
MRKLSFFFFLLFIAVSAPAQNNTAAKSSSNNGVNDKSRQEVAAFMKRFHEAFKSGNVEAIKKLEGPGSTYLGSDAKEIWTQEQFNNELQQSFQNKSVDYSVDREEVYMVNNQTAFVVDQFIFPEISTSIPVRLHYVLSKKGNNWMIAVMSVTLIPRNEDIPKLNAALKQ